MKNVMNQLIDAILYSTAIFLGVFVMVMTLKGL